MPDIQFLPGGGTRIHVGVTGQAGLSGKPVIQVSQSSEIKDKSVETDTNPSNHHAIQTTKYKRTDLTTETATRKTQTPAFGASVTLGQDVVAVNFGAKDKLLLGLEGSLGVSGAYHATHVTTTESGRTTRVHQVDKYDKQGNLQEHHYKETVQDEWQTTASQSEKDLKWKFQARVGASLGYSHDFAKCAVRVDALGGYNITAQSPYVGTRLTLASISSGIGVYGQVTTDPGQLRKAEAMQAELGVVFRL